MTPLEARDALIEGGIVIFDRPAGRAPTLRSRLPCRGDSGDGSPSSEAIDVDSRVDPSTPGAGDGFAAWTVAGDLTPPS